MIADLVLARYEKGTLLRALAKAKGDLEAINGSNPKLAKKLGVENFEAQKRIGATRFAIAYMTRLPHEGTVLVTSGSRKLSSKL